MGEFTLLHAGVILGALILLLLLHYKGQAAYWKGFAKGVEYNQNDELDEWHMDEIKWLRHRLKIQIEDENDQSRSV